MNEPLRVTDRRLLIIYVVNLVITGLFVWQLLSLRDTSIAVDETNRQASTAATTSEQNSRVLDRVEALTRLIQDCQTPKGTCFRAQKVQRAEQAGTINAITIAAAICAARVDRNVRELRSCIHSVIETGNPPERNK